MPNICDKLEARRWTIYGATDDLDEEGVPIRRAAYCDPRLRDGECVCVIEAAPVEAELERLRRIEAVAKELADRVDDWIGKPSS